MREPWGTGRGDRLVAAGLGVTTFLVLRLTSTAVGFTRDEGYYFKAAEDYVGWFRSILTGAAKLGHALSTPVIDRAFGYNHEHPALIKTLQGFCWWLWHEVAGVGLHSEAFRLPGPLMAAWCVALIYLLGTRLHGREVGVFAAVAWALMPRNFFHAHLACFDVPVTAMTVTVVYAYVRAGSSGARAAWCGVALGLCMATKHNALFLPPLLLVHWLVTEAGPVKRVAGGMLRLPGIPLVFVAMLVLGPLVFLAHWPWLWHDTLKRVGEYYGYHFLSHEHYPASYWGTLWRQPPFPWGFSFGMTLVTMPLPVLGLSAWGLVVAIKEGFFTRTAPGTPEAHHKHAAWILGPQALVPMLVISLPSTPIFGGIKHWMPGTPFLAILAGRGLVHLLGEAKPLLVRLHGSLGGPGAAYWLAPALLATSVTGILRSHPHGQSFYNEVIGGARGAALAGMQRTYWGEASRPLIPAINQQAPQGARVFWNRTNYDGFRMYQRDKVVRADMSYANGVAESLVSVPFHQWEHEAELYNTWNEYQSRQPVMGVYLEGGVPLTTLYVRQRR